MSEPVKRIIIPREKAVFWMDGNGVWHNEHGKFEHPKIIRYFNSSIQKDEKGYHLFQIRDGMEERVYFKYDKTPIFVIDLAANGAISLLLNTGKKKILDPGQLMEQEDCLYLDTPEHLIKFTDRAMLKLSRYLSEAQDRLQLTYGGVTWDIRKR